MRRHALGRLLVDASIIIATARVGELRFLQDVARPIHVTREIAAEILGTEKADVAPLKDLIKYGTIRVVEEKAEDAAPRPRGPGAGEASIIEAWRPGDLLVIDDRNARALAAARGASFTGLLGLIVEANREGLVTEAYVLEILGKLARSDFRMTIDLHDWARTEIGGSGHGDL